MGFNVMLGDKKLETPPDFKPPTMGLGKWASYMRNVASLSPIPKDMKFGEVPQGVRVLGGTYALDGDEVPLSRTPTLTLTLSLTLARALPVPLSLPLTLTQP